MQENQYSRTALATAFFRAYHATWDQGIIFNDFLARAIIGEAAYAKLAESYGRALPQLDPQLATTHQDQDRALGRVMRQMGAPATVLCRARYAEDCLAQAVGQGVSQYVILGAGMDSFAWRRPGFAEGLAVMEIDHPATQAYKRQRLAAAGLDMPIGLCLLPVDLAQARLDQTLGESALDSEAATFFSWMGVSYYLSRPEVMATLAAVAQAIPAGGQVVFDYLHLNALTGQGTSPSARLLQERVASLGEPMRTGLDPQTLGEELAQVGLRLAEDLDAEDIRRRYLQGEAGAYRLGRHIHLARAVVV